ncbi:ATP-binding cassette domain-containing protein [Streptomyces sp. ZSW22]|uniref:ATP-binding cassette domain-containing protein n=1 Tax=Streptomyces sp. ZSW22 TaxID=3055050 RepID=UPI0025AFCF55|nr:ATP-binding cassette domain-containing protein [Streptomyces sp. ZSW22]MDN3245345.1 ATP-binding cassette domain-containing protein [Streptomyces sp. ZSW22]
MIEAFGLTSNPRKELPPAVDDVSFEARAGRVTALLGASGAGKSTALRLMLELQRGRGLTHFRGRPLHRIAHPAREVGVLLGDVPGHPARTVRGHLRMLCAAAGVPVRRADEVLESVGLVSLRDERLGTLSRSMDRRLGVACALLPDPHTLVLDDPAGTLAARDADWVHATLRAHASQGGTVLFSTADPKEAARIADQVVTLERGRVVADQEAANFSRTRLRPRVAVRTPHAARLAAVLTKEARAARRSVEVVREGGNRLAVYGSTCADIGDTAFRHSILVHQLADEVGDMGPGAGAEPAARWQEAGNHWEADAGSTAAAPNGDVSRPSGDPGPSAGAGVRLVPGKALPRADAPQPSPEGTAPVTAAAEAPPSADGALPAVADAAAQSAGADTASSPAAAEPRPDIPRPTRDGSRPGPETVPYPAGARESAGSNGQACPTPHRAGDVPAPHAPHAPAARSTRTAPVGARATSRRHASLTPTPALTGQARSSLPPPVSVRAAPSPLRPLRYELRRAAGIRTGFVTCAVVLLLSAVIAVVLARVGHTPQPRLLAAWPQELPLPPAALGAGLLGALASGDEFRHPALAADRGAVPRRLGLLTAKLLVSAATAVLLAALTVGCNAEVLHLFYGRELAGVPADWPALGAGWLGLVVGCGWAGVLAAGVFRSTTAGLAAVLAVPVLVVPLVQRIWDGPSVRTAAGLPMRTRELLLATWPFGGERYVAEVLRVIVQPVGSALTLSLTTLLCAYLLMTVRSRPQ